MINFWRNSGEPLVVFRGKTSAQETHVQLRTSFSSVKRELSSMGGGGGGFYDQNGLILLSGCILRPHRRTDIFVTREK